MQDDEEGDISLSAPITAAIQQSKPDGKEGATTPKGATTTSEMCHFCKTKEHPSWRCPKTVEERPKIALKL
jgi:hypothetical protein